MVSDINEKQNVASNPNYSIWVGASAGSGKTTILTKRLIRLLLNGAELSKIVCITFTKTGAMEMKTRIQNELEKLVLLDDNELKTKLESLNEYSEVKMKKARILFAKILDKYNELQIMTIHSFCEQIIKKFALEAKVLPNFSIIEDNEKTKLINDIRLKLFKDENLKEEISFIFKYKNEEQINSLLDDALQKKDDLLLLKEKYSFENIDIILKTLLSNENIDYNIDDLQDEFFGVVKQKELDNCLSNPKNTHNSEHHTKCKSESASKYGKITAEPVFLTKSIITHTSQDIKENNTKLIDFLFKKNWKIVNENLNEYLRTKDTYFFKTIFLTKEGEKRLLLIKEANPPELIALTDKVYNLVEKEKSELNYKMSKSFLKIMYEFFDLYKQEKQAKGVLDFNDLIYNTKKLLSTEHILDWVKYKLDGGIEHFLIDEAQDTNSIQWEIVKELAEEFFATDNEKNRTLFVVGDEKQSIYGFQGAELEKFNTEYNFYKDKSKDFSKIDLDTSFRTLQPILSLVDATTEYIKQDTNISDDLKRIFDTKHIANRKNGIAKITLFPLVKAEDENNEVETDDGFDTWNLDTKTKITSEQLLAEGLANEIKSWFDNKREIITEKEGKRQIKYSDIMVLLQKRTDKEFINSLLKEFNEKGLKVNGYDRFLLKNNIIIKDIIALCKVLLFSNDDFNLANIIKSPFLNMNENDLFDIFYDKKGIFNTLDNPFINDIKEKIKTFSLYEFFYYIFEIKNIRNEFQKRHPYTADEVINEFLKIINEYEKTKNNATLMNFLDFFESTDFELKRETDKEQDVITIMTAHGSKGMESLIVILADANEKTANFNRSGLFYAPLPQDIGKFIPIIKLENTKIIDEIKEYDSKKTKEEKLRLLYVAMTRAENELYICGKQMGKVQENVSILQQTWYEILSNVITKSADFKQVENPNFDGITYSCESGNDESKQQIYNIKEENLYELKGWNGKIKETKIEEKIINPSLYYNEKSVIGDKSNKKAIEKGLLVHKLLEILPPLKKEEQEQILEGQPIEIKSIISNILTKYTEFFEENSSAEVPVFGYVDNDIVSGQIDRLVYTDNIIKIIDYKNSAKKPDIAPEKYVKQLECYKKILEQIHKDKKIECYLLWTQQAIVEKIF
ncbi:MAG: hypothetical protein Ta2D_00160 [Rickettsiales bacterium]|nr:MAG: hypothetical protein Ta2D_00160 [Rickettsiales bacterium]